MPAEPKVSVIVPVYNVERYLKQCLDSLIGQTLQDIEIICVDDAGTDSSADIAEGYARQYGHVHLVKHEVNRGLSAARNSGMAVARAPYIMFCDGDDTYAPLMCERMVAALDHALDAAFAVCGVEVIYECHEAMAPVEENYYRVKYRGKVTLTDEVLQRTNVSACNKIFRKACIESYRLTFPEGLHYEDSYFFSIYGMRSSCAVYLPENLYRYVRRAGSIMSHTLEGSADYNTDHLRVGMAVYHYLCEHGLADEHLHYFGKLYFTLLQAALRYAGSPGEKHALYKLAETLLLESGVDFAAYPDLIHARQLLKLGIYPGEVRKMCFGLLRSKYKQYCVKYYLCGIPCGTSTMR